MKSKSVLRYICCLLIIMMAILFPCSISFADEGNEDPILRPKPTAIVSVTSSNNSITCKWKKSSEKIDGYQVAYCTKSTFPRSEIKYKTFRDPDKTQILVKRLPAGRTYYMKVRVLRRENGSSVYSQWSAAKSVKVKAPVLSVNAKSAIIMEAGSGNVLYKKNSNVKRANASTTKMMTAILAIEGKSLNSKVKITAEAVRTPYSNLGSSAIGDQIRLKDLLHLVLLPSDNGAATAAGIHVSGSTTAFVKKMNKKAAALGMKNTHFRNPHGLDANGHYSSAKDLAILADYCLKNKTFSEIVRKRNYSFTSIGKGRRYYANTTNKLLGNVSGVIGCKTGSEVNAGYCFVCAYRHGGKTYITVVLGCPADQYRWTETRKLIKYIDKNL